MENMHAPGRLPAVKWLERMWLFGGDVRFGQPLFRREFQLVLQFPEKGEKTWLVVLFVLDVNKKIRMQDKYLAGELSQRGASVVIVAP